MDHVLKPAGDLAGPQEQLGARAGQLSAHLLPLTSALLCVHLLFHSFLGLHDKSRASSQFLTFPDMSAATEENVIIPLCPRLHFSPV